MKLRKPKVHPKWPDVNLVGINFRERWNIVEYATKEEICRFIANDAHIKKVKREMHQQNNYNWWERKQAIVDEATQNVYLRKLWRKRHSESFEKDVLYRVERNIRRWNLKLGPKTGDGLAVSYHFDRNTKNLNKDDILVLTKTDEMGNLYFSKADEIDAPNPYVFNRENAQLGWIREIES